jgi:uncharacterized protein YrrD
MKKVIRLKAGLEMRADREEGEGMSEVKIFNVANQLCGMPVIVPDTSERLGKVSDVIVNPTDGRALGILLRTIKGEERAIAINDCFIFSDANAVLAAENALVDSESIRDAMTGAQVCQELIGADVVTEAGELLGDVSDVYVVENPAKIIYRVTASALQRFFGGGFFLAGNVPRFYWRESARLIVPAYTGEDYSAHTLDEAINLMREAAMVKRNARGA